MLSQNRVDSDISELEKSEFEISFSVESYDKTTAGKWQKFLRCRKTRRFQIVKDMQLKFCIAQIEDLNQNCVKISRPYL